MKTSFWRVAIIILCICILSCLLSCGLEHYYTEFNIKSITDNLDENIFVSDNFEFAKVENVVIIPKISETNEESYEIIIGAYSETGIENIIVQNVILTEGNHVLLNYALNQEVHYEQYSDGSYGGYIVLDTFSQNQVEVADGKEYGLMVEVEINTNVGTVSKNITFDTVIKGYRSFVFPT